MPVWALLVWLIIGGAAGFVAQKIMGGQSPGGLFGMAPPPPPPWWRRR